MSWSFAFGGKRDAVIREVKNVSTWDKKEDPQLEYAKTVIESEVSKWPDSAKVVVTANGHWTADYRQFKIEINGLPFFYAE